MINIIFASEIKTKDMKQKTALQAARERQRKKIIAMWEEQRPQTPPNISDHKIMVGIADELRTCVQTVHKILMKNGKIQPKRTKPQV